MLWFGKLKEDARKVFKEHPASIIACFLGFFFLGVIDDILSRFAGTRNARDVMTFLSDVCFSFAPALVLCESNFRYKQKIGKISSLMEIKKSAVYIVVLVIAAFMSIRFAALKADPDNHIYSVFDVDAIGADDLFIRFFVVYLAVCCISAVFFLYKKSGESFESYFVKGFLGILKGEVAYGVVLLGGLCIIWVFQTLIYDIDAIAIVVALISGVMAYPAFLVALSHPGEKVSKFGNIMMGYVFPGLLAAAFIIIYVYILKIVFTWKFPSNEAFAIVTALFISGICFWSMAQGCTEGRYNKMLRIMPLLFIPFIVIQIICLYMRVAQYGITTTRYFGILLIVFEILYEIIYIVRWCLNKGMEWILFPMTLAFVIVSLVFPWVNVCASVTRSQGRVVERYIEDTLAGKETASKDLAGARSAYRVIDRDAGFEGARYIEKLKKKFPGFDVDKELNDSSSSSQVQDPVNYYYANNDIASFDTDGYARVGNIAIDDYSKDVDIRNVGLRYKKGGEVFGRVDLSGVISKMQKLREDGDEYEDAIREPVRFTDDSKLYITYISFEEQGGVISDLHINGFYLFD